MAAAYFESTDAKRISVALNKLRYGPNGPRSDEERASGEWRGMLADVLRDVSAWAPEGSAADYFHQKATVLRTLLEITPAGSDRMGVVKLCAEFLASAAMERDSPAEWLWQVRSLAEGAGADREALLEAFRESGDAGLGLFAALGLG